jgi:hypothetical protein
MDEAKFTTEMLTQPQNRRQLATAQEIDDADALLAIADGLQSTLNAFTVNIFAIAGESHTRYGANGNGHVARVNAVEGWTGVLNQAEITVTSDIFDSYGLTNAETIDYSLMEFPAIGFETYYPLMISDYYTFSGNQENGNDVVTYDEFSSVVTLRVPLSSDCEKYHCTPVCRQYSYDNYSWMTDLGTNHVSDDVVECYLESSGFVAVFWTEPLYYTYEFTATILDVNMSTWNGTDYDDNVDVLKNAIVNLSDINVTTMTVVESTVSQDNNILVTIEVNDSILTESEFLALVNVNDGDTPDFTLDGILAGVGVLINEFEQGVTPSSDDDVDMSLVLIIVGSMTALILMTALIIHSCRSHQTKKIQMAQKLTSPFDDLSNIGAPPTLTQVVQGATIHDTAGDSTDFFDHSDLSSTEESSLEESNFVVHV